MARHFLTAILGILFVWHTWAAESAPVASPYVVIAHLNVSPEWITRKKLRAAFSMRLHRWPDGTPVKVVTFGGQTALLDGFSLHCLGIPGRILERIWTRNIYAGIGSVPTIVSKPEKMVEEVAIQPGAVGFLAKEDWERLRQRQPFSAIRVFSGVCK